MSRERDERFMRRAIAVARPMLGRTWPNPVVGCVIAKGDVVLAEASTRGTPVASLWRKAR